MNSDKKISINKKEMRLFIDEQLYPDMSDTKTDYDFVTEFEQTKRNRSYKLILLMLGTICAVVAITYALSTVIDTKNKEITVGISAFEDLNLNKLLDRFSRAETKLASAQNDRKNLEIQFNSDLQQLQSREESDQFTLNALGLPAAETRKKRETVRQQYADQKAAIENTYRADAARLDESIEQLKTELADIDSTNVRRAQEQQAIIDSQRTLHELEKQQMEEAYQRQTEELNQKLQLAVEEGAESQKKAVETVSRQYKQIIDGLDPVFTDQRGKLLVERFASKTPPQFPEFPQAALNENNRQLLGELEQNAGDMEYMVNFLADIPQKNSAPQYSAAVRGIGYRIMENAANLLFESLSALKDEQSQSAVQRQTIEKQQADIDKLKQTAAALETQRNDLAAQNAQYGYYLDFTANSSGDAGFIIDARDKNRMAVFISPLYAELADGAAAYVINKAGDLTGSVTLKKTKTGFFAVPLPETPQDSVSVIKENDRILLRLTTN